uniref:Tudor domain-containing protein n=1 Tax=Brugia timori TaxID=42155 RepID=A0A0R3QR33_9BILA
LGSNAQFLVTSCFCRILFQQHEWVIHYETARVDVAGKFFRKAYIHYDDLVRSPDEDLEVLLFERKEEFVSAGCRMLLNKDWWNVEKVLRQTEQKIAVPVSWSRMMGLTPDVVDIDNTTVHFCK